MATKYQDERDLYVLEDTMDENQGTEEQRMEVIRERFRLAKGSRLREYLARKSAQRNQVN